MNIGKIIKVYTTKDSLELLAFVFFYIVLDLNVYLYSSSRKMYERFS